MLDFDKLNDGKGWCGTTMTVHTAEELQRQHTEALRRAVAKYRKPLKEFCDTLDRESEVLLPNLAGDRERAWRARVITVLRAALKEAP